jgi:peroxiredoxin
VTDDRFDDLGQTGAERRESIGERLAERDRTHPEPGSQRPPEVPRTGNKYAWLVGLVLLMGIAVLLFRSAIPNAKEGVQGPPKGHVAPAFAAPLVTSNLEGEANVCQRGPCSRNAGRIPACQVRAADVLNSCQLRSRPLVLTFVFDRGADCLPEVDRAQTVADQVRGVRFATIFFSRKDRDTVRRIVQGRQWRMPVAQDSDGAIANLYRVGGCPTTIFSAAGGEVRETALGNLTEDQLRARAERLARSG